MPFHYLNYYIRCNPQNVGVLVKIPPAGGGDMRLTDAKVKTATVPDGKTQIKLADGGGLYLLVKPSGKYWRMKYRFNGKEGSPLAIGVYPEVSLKQARAAREDAKKMLCNNIDPNQAKKATKRKVAMEANAAKFEGVASEWYTKMLPTWAESTARHNKTRLDNYIFPQIGSLPIKDIKPFEILLIARIAESKGYNELAHRIIRLCGQAEVSVLGSSYSHNLKSSMYCR